MFMCRDRTLRDHWVIPSLLHPCLRKHYAPRSVINVDGIDQVMLAYPKVVSLRRWHNASNIRVWSPITRVAWSRSYWKVMWRDATWLQCSLDVGSLQFILVLFEKDQTPTLHCIAWFNLRFLSNNGCVCFVSGICNEYCISQSTALCSRGWCIADCQIAHDHDVLLDGIAMETHKPSRLCDAGRNMFCADPCRGVSQEMCQIDYMQLDVAWMT